MTKRYAVRFQLVWRSPEENMVSLTSKSGFMNFIENRNYNDRES